MNMHNKQYATNFSHCSTTNSQPVPIPKQWLWNPEFTDFLHFVKFPWKTELPVKFEFTDKGGFKLTEKRQYRKRIPVLWPASIYKLSIMSMVSSISIGQLGLDAWLCSLTASAHLLIISAWETRKSPLFLSNV